MVQAVVNIDEKVNRVLNVVKAKFGFRDKSEAINYVVSEYEDNLMEPELRPEFIAKIDKIEKIGKFNEYSSLTEFRRKIEHA